MGQVSSSSASCASLANLASCFAGSNEPGGFSAESVIPGPQCVWVFAPYDDHSHSAHTYGAEVALGQCYALSADLCRAPGSGFDPYEQVQSAVLPGVNNGSLSNILLPTLHQCLNLSNARRGIGIAAMVSTVIMVCLCTALSVRGAPERLYQFTHVFNALVITLLVIFTVYISWTESVPDVALLPTFALLTLSLEGLHWVPSPRSRKAEASEGLLQRAIGVIKALLSGVVASLFSLGMVIQFIAAHEFAAVRGIAWVDAAVTLLQGIMMMLGRGLTHSHHLKDHPHMVGGLTVAWACGLMVIGIFMELSCPPEDFLSPSATETAFEKCEQRIVGRAYALAFMSMLRQVVLVVLDAFMASQHNRAHAKADGDLAAKGHGHGVATQEMPVIAAWPPPIGKAAVLADVTVAVPNPVGPRGVLQ